MSINLASILKQDKSSQENFSVGSRIIIQPDNLSASRQYLTYATGEIKEIKGSKASVLLDEPTNLAYKPHTVQVELCSLILGASELHTLNKKPNQQETWGTSLSESLISSISVLPPSPTTLHIDQEFKNLIPPLSSDESAQLFANLKEFGCIDPLVVWQSTSILLDGHNRYEVCTNEQIPYKIVEIDLPSREAAICWIANHQLGRRNITPETASYLRGKRYLHLKGNREDNLKQNLPKGNFCPSGDDSEEQDLPLGNFCLSVNTAKTLAEQYKVSERTIKNDAQFTAALDTLASALGDELKHTILTRTAGLTKKEILSLAKVVRNEGKEFAQKLLDNKRNSLDITQQIKDLQRVPNPHHVGFVCQIVAKGNPELKKFSGCWSIIREVNTHSCYVWTWKMDFPTVKPENLEPIYVECEAEAAQNCVRIRRLTDRIYEEFDSTHAAVLEALGRVADPSRLTPKQERILAFLENEYNL